MPQITGLYTKYLTPSAEYHNSLILIPAFTLLLLFKQVVCVGVSTHVTPPHTLQKENQLKNEALFWNQSILFGVFLSNSYRELVNLQ